MSDHELIIIIIGFIVGNFTFILLDLLYLKWKARRRRKTILVPGNLAELFKPGLAQEFRDAYNSREPDFKDPEPTRILKEQQSNG